LDLPFQKGYTKLPKLLKNVDALLIQPMLGQHWGYLQYDVPRLAILCLGSQTCPEIVTTV
jgi:hypothetical protein